MIRPAGIGDIDALLALEEALFDNAMSERMLRYELENGRGWIYGDMFGYILTRPDGALVDIVRLGVLPDHQRKGIGQALLSRALLGVSDAVLTVKKDNLPAMKLYERWGFKVVAHLSGAGAFVMRRTLT